MSQRPCASTRVHLLTGSLLFCVSRSVLLFVILAKLRNHFSSLISPGMRKAKHYKGWMSINSECAIGTQTHYPEKKSGRKTASLLLGTHSLNPAAGLGFGVIEHSPGLTLPVWRLLCLGITLGLVATIYSVEIYPVGTGSGCECTHVHTHNTHTLSLPHSYKNPEDKLDKRRQMLLRDKVPALRNVKLDSPILTAFTQIHNSGSSAANGAVGKRPICGRERGTGNWQATCTTKCQPLGSDRAIHGGWGWWCRFQNQNSGQDALGGFCIDGTIAAILTSFPRKTLELNILPAAKGTILGDHPHFRFLHMPTAAPTMAEPILSLPSRHACSITNAFSLTAGWLGFLESPTLGALNPKGVVVFKAGPTRREDGWLPLQKRSVVTRSLHREASTGPTYYTCCCHPSHQQQNAARPPAKRVRRGIVNARVKSKFSTSGSRSTECCPWSSLLKPYQFCSPSAMVWEPSHSDDLDRVSFVHKGPEKADRWASPSSTSQGFWFHISHASRCRQSLSLKIRARLPEIPHCAPQNLLLGSTFHHTVNSQGQPGNWPPSLLFCHPCSHCILCLTLISYCATSVFPSAYYLCCPTVNQDGFPEGKEGSVEGSPQLEEDLPMGSNGKPTRLQRLENCSLT
ncbi:hypothetical protein E2320_013607 [Naja naja]|nr:hypothetical protein E2320_013607 [Naja naja]